VLINYGGTISVNHGKYYHVLFQMCMGIAILLSVFTPEIGEIGLQQFPPLPCYLPLA